MSSPSILPLMFGHADLKVLIQTNFGPWHYRVFLSVGLYLFSKCRVRDKLNPRFQWCKRLVPSQHRACNPDIRQAFPIWWIGNDNAINLVCAQVLYPHLLEGDITVTPATGHLPAISTIRASISQPIMSSSSSRSIFLAASDSNFLD